MQRATSPWSAGAPRGQARPPTDTLRLAFLLTLQQQPSPSLLTPHLPAWEPSCSLRLGGASLSWWVSLQKLLTFVSNFCNSGPTSWRTCSSLLFPCPLRSCPRLAIRRHVMAVSRARGDLGPLVPDSSGQGSPYPMDRCSPRTCGGHPPGPPSKYSPCGHCGTCWGQSLGPSNLDLHSCQLAEPHRGAHSGGPCPRSTATSGGSLGVCCVISRNPVCAKPHPATEQAASRSLGSLCHCLLAL